MSPSSNKQLHLSVTFEESSCGNERHAVREQTQPQESSLKQQELQICSTPSDPISNMSDSLPARYKDIHIPQCLADTTSHESIDWTNATEATSFSEHDDVAVAAEENYVNNKGNHKNTPSKIRATKVVGDLTSRDDLSSASENSIFSASVSCGTSECAVKVGVKDGRIHDDDDDESWNDVPVVITLINDNVRNNDDEDMTGTITAATSITPERNTKEHSSKMQESVLLRLERAVTMIESYRSTLKSNEHLIESLEQTLLETRESAQDLWVERNRLEQELDETLEEQDAILMLEKNCMIRRIHTCVLALSLAYFLLGGSEYVLIFVSTVYLLEDILSMSL
jgi:hypothetical protein